MNKYLDILFLILAPFLLSHPLLSQDNISNDEVLINSPIKEIDLLLHKINSIEPITLKKKMYKTSTKLQTLLYLDKSKKITYVNLMAKNFQPATVITLPGKFNRGKYNNWIMFQLINPYADTMKIIIRGNLEKDSFWIFDSNNFLQKGYIDFPPKFDTTETIKIPTDEIFLLKVPPFEKRKILIKNYDYVYRENAIFPLISDAENFESTYFKQYSNLIFWYTFAFGTLCAIIILFTIQCIYMKDVVLFWYVIFCITNGFIIWRYLEETNLHLYSTLYYIEWTYSKLFQSVVSIVSYALFIGYFLNFKPNLLKVVIKFIIIISFIATVTEILLLNFDLYWSWFFYYCYRIMATLAGIFTIFLISKSTGIIARLILIGCFLLLSSEIISWFFGGQTASMISLFGVMLELIVFSIALGLRTKIMFDDNTRLKIEKLNHEKEKEIAASNIKSQIASDIHDDMGLSLTSLKFLMLNINRKNDKSSNISSELNQISNITDELSERITEIVWSMNADKDNLQEFCFDIKRHFYTFIEEYNYDGQLKLPSNIINIPMPGSIRRNLFLCIKEALNNVVKHSGANSITMKIDVLNDVLTICIQDNGNGMIEDISNNNPFGGNGLKNMKKRISLMNGKIEIRNQNGFCLLFEIPIVPHL